MKKLDFKTLAGPAVALFVICLVASFLLGGTNALTAEKIVQTEKAQSEVSRKTVFSAAASFGEEQTLTLADGKNVVYHEALDEQGTLLGYVFTTVNKGYGGDVKIMTGIDKAGTVLRIAVLAMDDETPGLGQNAKKEDFTKQFDGTAGTLEWVKNDPAEGQIQGVTSASFTSRAVIQCVNDAREAFDQLGGAK